MYSGEAARIRSTVFCENCGDKVGVLTINPKGANAVMRHVSIGVVCVACSPGGYWPRGRSEITTPLQETSFTGFDPKVVKGTITQSVPLPRGIAGMVLRWFQKRRRSQ